MAYKNHQLIFASALFVTLPKQHLIHVLLSQVDVYINLCLGQTIPPPATAINPVCPEWRLKISILIVSSVMFGFSQVSEKTRTSYASASLRVMSILGQCFVYSCGRYTSDLKVFQKKSQIESHKKKCCLQQCLDQD